MYGTIAHSYILSYSDTTDLGPLRKVNGVDIVDRANFYRADLKVAGCRIA